MQPRHRSIQLIWCSESLSDDVADQATTSWRDIRLLLFVFKTNPPLPLFAALNTAVRHAGGSTSGVAGAEG